MFPGDVDDRLDVEVRPDRFTTLRRADQERLVGLEAVQRKAIFVTVDRHGAQAEFGGGPEAPDGNLRSIGDEQFPHMCKRTLQPVPSSYRLARVGTKPKVECPRTGEVRQASL